MIKLENVVLASPEQMEFIIQGMRNPMNSWGRSDSTFIEEGEYYDILGNSGPAVGEENRSELGPDDLSLMQRLSNAGTEHRKYLRMMPVYVRITAPLYWWKEFDTYKVGTVANSCSTMHKIAEKEFTLEDFSCEHLMDFEEKGKLRFSPLGTLQNTIDELNDCRDLYLKTKDKAYWWQLIQLLPSSYNQTRNVMLNYEVLANVYRQRKGHKLDEWREVCKWIETLPYSELITGLSIGSDQSITEKRFTRPFPWIKEDDVYCNNCEHFHDCLNKGGLVDVTTGNDITKDRDMIVRREKNMNDNKVSVKESLEKLYDLSWTVGSTAMEYLTDKDGEKIRDYIGVIEDRINDLEKELSEFKKYFEPYDIDEETAEAIIRSKCPNIDSAKDYIQSRLAEDDPMSFSVGKIVHDLIAKELTEDVKKQILEEDSK